MIRDITLGQYYNSNSVLHRLDPRVKLFGTIIFLISLFSAQSVVGYVIATFALISLIVMSKVPFKFITKGLKAIVIILLLSVCINLFITPGQIVFSYKFVKITKEGIIISVKITIRLIYLIIGSSLLTLTTTPNELTDGMEKAFGCLKKIHYPVHEMAMMMSIALRFIPILMEETDKIIKAQTARGADFESGSFIKKAKNMLPILVPLFISAFRRANDLAIAMDARCYRGGAGRTKMKPLKYSKADIVSYVICVFYLAAVISTNFINILHWSSI